MQPLTNTCLTGNSSVKINYCVNLKKSIYQYMFFSIFEHFDGGWTKIHTDHAGLQLVGLLGDTSIRPTIPEIWPKKLLTLKKHIGICQNNIFLNRISPKSNQVITMTRARKLPRFVVIRWVVPTLSRRQAIFANGRHSRDLGSRSWKGHPVHFPRPIYSLCQIWKV